MLDNEGKEWTAFYLYGIKVSLLKFDNKSKLSIKQIGIVHFLEGFTKIECDSELDFGIDSDGEVYIGINPKFTWDKNKLNFETETDAKLFICKKLKLICLNSLSEIFKNIDYQEGMTDDFY